MPYCEVTSEIDNALQHQKDILLGALANATESDPDWQGMKTKITCIKTVKMVVEMLRLNRELWIVLGYGYKGGEIAQRICQAAYHSKEWLHHKATKQKKELEIIIASCESMMIDFDAKPHL